MGEYMKIMMISSGYYPESCGGVEIITQALAEKLVEKNHEIVVLYSKEEVKQNEIYYHNGVKVIKLMPKIIKKKGKVTSIVNRYLQMYNFFNKKRIREIILNEKPDIIHVHMPRIISYSVYAVAKEEKIATIATLHEYYSLWNYNPFLPMEFMIISRPTLVCQLLRKLQKKAIKKVEYVLSPYDKVIKKYRKEGYFINSKMKEIKNALNIDIITCKEEISHKKEKLKSKKIRSFLIIGRLIQFKGIEEILEAFHQWRVENVELIIAGDGPLRNFVEAYCKKDKRIKYLGFVKDEAKTELFRKTDVLLFLVSDIETFGLVCLEGYSFGMPTISTDTGATKRVVEQGKTGLRIADTNVDTIQRAMQKYVNFEEWENQMDYCMHKLEEFNFAMFIDKHLEIYNEILQRKQHNIRD